VEVGEEVGRMWREEGEEIQPSRLAPRAWTAQPLPSQPLAPPTGRRETSKREWNTLCSRQKVQFFSVSRKNDIGIGF
jgi:hypothetical protein